MNTHEEKIQMSMCYILVAHLRWVVFQQTIENNLANNNLSFSFFLIGAFLLKPITCIDWNEVSWAKRLVGKVKLSMAVTYYSACNFKYSLISW